MASVKISVCCMVLLVSLAYCYPGYRRGNEPSEVEANGGLGVSDSDQPEIIHRSAQHMEHEILRDVLRDLNLHDHNRRVVSVSSYQHRERESSEQEAEVTSVQVIPQSTNLGSYGSYDHHHRQPDILLSSLMMGIMSRVFDAEILDVRVQKMTNDDIIDRRKSSDDKSIYSA